MKEALPSLRSVLALVVILLCAGPSLAQLPSEPAGTPIEPTAEQALAKDRPGADYGLLPPRDFTLEGMTADLIDVFEGHHPMTMQDAPVPERLSELRPLVYAPHMTSTRFASELEAPLEALQDAVKSASQLQERKRGLLLIRVRHLIEFIQHRARWSLC